MRIIISLSLQKTMLFFTS